jgi:hypothetical protein
VLLVLLAEACDLRQALTKIGRPRLPTPASFHVCILITTQLPVIVT